MKLQAGFTLIELMISLGVAIISVGIGLPDLVRVVASSRATTQVNDMLSGLNLARSESIKRGSPVDFSAAAGGWADGWVVGIDGNGDGDYIDGGDLLIRTWSPQGSSLTPINTGGLSTITYNSRGNLGSATAFTLTDCPAGTINGRRLALGASGHAETTKVACDG